MITTRTCIRCQKKYRIQDYDQANPKIRDYCLHCVHEKIAEERA